MLRFFRTLAERLEAVFQKLCRKSGAIIRNFQFQIFAFYGEFYRNVFLCKSESICCNVLSNLKQRPFIQCDSAACGQDVKVKLLFVIGCGKAKGFFQIGAQGSGVKSRFFQLHLLQPLNLAHGFHIAFDAPCISSSAWGMGVTA